MAGGAQSQAIKSSLTFGCDSGDGALGGISKDSVSGLVPRRRGRGATPRPPPTPHMPSATQTEKQAGHKGGHISTYSCVACTMHLRPAVPVGGARGDPCKPPIQHGRLCAASRHCAGDAAYSMMDRAYYGTARSTTGLRVSSTAVKCASSPCKEYTFRHQHLSFPAESRSEIVLLTAYSGSILCGGFAGLGDAAGFDVDEHILHPGNVLAASLGGAHINQAHHALP